jgi:hypothetical protein
LPIFPRQQSRKVTIFCPELAYAGSGNRKTLRGETSLVATLVATHPGMVAFSMLQRNPLHPPRPFVTPAPAAEARAARDCGFVSAEDFDATGVLAGVDPCESRYWWMPELYGPESEAVAESTGLDQATRRTASRATAAA